MTGIRPPQQAEPFPLLSRLLGELAVPRGWTLQRESGAGFVVGELGTWLTLGAAADATRVVHVEVRVGVDVHDSTAAADFCNDRNHKTLVGRWVHDPELGIVALVATLPLARPRDVPVGAEAVAEMVNAAETVAFFSGPAKALEGLNAVTLLRGRRRKRSHPLLEHLPKHTYVVGENSDGGEVLPLVQDGLLYALPGWYVEHEDAESWAYGPDGTRLVVRAARHPHAGGGLMIALSHDAWTVDRDDALPYLAALNRSERTRAGGGVAAGCWTHNAGSLEYRVFSSALLLERAGDPVAAGDVALSLIAAAAKRSDPLLLDRDPPQPDQPVLLHPVWPGDNEARVLARRNQWNDGLDSDGPDLSIYIDFLGRGCGISDASFAAWWSRLTPEDRQDPGVAGFADFVRARQTERPSRSAEIEDR